MSYELLKQVMQGIWYSIKGNLLINRSYILRAKHKRSEWVKDANELIDSIDQLLLIKDEDFGQAKELEAIRGTLITIRNKMK